MNGIDFGAIDAPLAVVVLAWFLHYLQKQFAHVITVQSEKYGEFRKQANDRLDLLTQSLIEQNIAQMEYIHNLSDHLVLSLGNGQGKELLELIRENRVKFSRTQDVLLSRLSDDDDEKGRKRAKGE